MSSNHTIAVEKSCRLNTTGQIPNFHFAIAREDKDSTNYGLDREEMSENVTIDNNEDDGAHNVDNEIIKAMLYLRVAM